MNNCLQQTRMANPGEWGEHDFQDNHIIIFKYLVFNEKNCKAYKESRKYDPKKMLIITIVRFWVE